MLKNKKGFTLAEVMVTLAVCGILASLLLPSIANVRPDKSKALFKKAYYIAERMVFELVNDDDFYPGQGEAIGLDNTIVASYLGQTFEGQSKFCGLFARKVNTTDDDAIHCDADHSVPTGNGTYKEPSFMTTDGIAWYVPFSKFETSSSNTTGAQTIYVDVNNQKRPNCKYNATTCKDPDIFEIKVLPDGKMFVDGDKEKSYLRSTEVTKDR